MVPSTAAVTVSTAKRHRYCIRSIKTIAHGHKVCLSVVEVVIVVESGGGVMSSKHGDGAQNRNP